MTSVIVRENECEAAGVDQKEANRIMKGLTRYTQQANKLGLKLFVGSSGLSLRFDDGTDRALVCAESVSHVNADGGDGATWDDEQGLLRGES